MHAEQPQQASAPNGRHASGTTALVFGTLSIAIPVINVILVTVSIATVSQGLQMVTALLFVPFGGVIAAVLGVVAIVLAFVCRAKSKGADRRWVIALVMGIVGALATPVTLAVIFAMVDAGGFT